MQISDDMTLPQALAMFGLVLRPGTDRCRRALYRDGQLAGFVTHTQAWNLAKALSDDGGYEQSNVHHLEAAE